MKAKDRISVDEKGGRKEAEENCDDDEIEVLDEIDEVVIGCCDEELNEAIPELLDEVEGSMALEIDEEAGGNVICALVESIPGPVRL